MKKIILLISIILIFLISCSRKNDNSELENLKNIPEFIYQENLSTWVFEYNVSNKINKTNGTRILPPKIGEYPDVYKYDSSNRLTKIVMSDSKDVIFDLVYDSNNRLVSYKNNAHQGYHINRIDLSYNDNKIIQKVFTDNDLNNINNFELAFEVILTFENGNIIKREVSNYSVTNYFYDNYNSPFINMEHFDVFQSFLSNSGAIIAPGIYNLKELFYGKNNLIREEFKQTGRDNTIITDYEYTYNSNQFPVRIKQSTNIGVADGEITITYK